MSTNSATSASPEKARNTLFTPLKESVGAAEFPSWKTLRGLSTPAAEVCKFNKRMDDNYRYYRPEHEQEKHEADSSEVPPLSMS
ncbi:hypothetical protein LZ554_004320 [Drepanopeziza brunnea f. sp. 'monogermtubi']|nr:hypothetical protein LZ554_004320 [Drepanopeziza brunnea f. sp. 'monogermtubi']